MCTSKPIRFCPSCGKDGVTEGWVCDGKTIQGGFVESGDYDGTHYEIEGSVNTYRCPHCHTEFASFS